MLNSVVLNGKLPHFEPTVYKPAEGDQKAFLVWALSVKKNYKKPDEQYYPEILVKFKAYGPTATFIMSKFNKGDGLIAMGSLDKEDDYVDPDTQKEIKGGLIFVVNSVDFAEGNRGSNEGSAPAKSTPVGRGGKGSTPAPRPGQAPKPQAPTGGRPPMPAGGKRPPMGLPPIGRR